MKTLLAGMLLAITVIALMGWNCVPDLTANQLSKKMQVNVEIGKITGDLNKIIVDKIEIDNPENSMLSQAFTCNKITLNAALSNYLKEDVVIEEIDLEDVYFDFEFDKARGEKGNWSTIMHNVLDTQEELENEAASTSEPGDDTRSVLIKNLVLINVRTDLVYRNKDKAESLPPIDRIVIKDLKSEGGPVINQIIKLVLGQSIKAVFKKQNIKHELPGGHLRYLLPLRRMSSMRPHIQPIERS